MIFIFALLVFVKELNLINSNKIFDYSHAKGDPLNILAGTLSSRRAIIPFDYTKLNICQSTKILKAEDTLGEILTGESLYMTGYRAVTNEDSFCKTLCYNSFSQTQVNAIQKLI